MNEFHQAIQAEDHAGDLSVRECLMPLFRRKKTVIAVFLGVLTAILLFAALTGPTYSSHMAILVNRERLDPLVSTEATTQMITTSTPVTEEEVNSEVELLNSQDVLEKVVLANGLWVSKGFSLGDLLRPHASREDRIARAVKTLAKKLKIEVTTKTNLIEITYKSDDPQRSYAVLKSLGDFYTAKHVSVHRPAGSYEFFARETERYGNKDTTQSREGANRRAETWASQASLKQANHGHSPEGMPESASRHWCGESRFDE
jgi:uncharacterized protein involved in exopolysaccharide biosynthesis